MIEIFLNLIAMEHEKERMLKILMLEDSEDDVGLIEHVLRKDNLAFVRECVDTREEFNEAIVRFKPDVVLSDHGLPGFNSREALKICLSERASTPFILVTGTVSDDYAISCMRAGADDYVLKSNLARLPSAIRSAVRKRRIEKLKREARYALRKQNNELLKVNQELDNFVYSVSHNLRGPLASVIGLLNIAQTENDPDSIKPLLAMMGNSIAKLDDTLKEILEYSKNARNEIQLSEINWNSLIGEGLHKLEYLDAGNRISKHIHIKTNVPFFSDASRIGPALTNVLSNAIIYSHKERQSFVNIDITVSETEAVVCVSDNGIGIRPDIMPKVYTMFYRGVEESQGAGLGLYIVKEIVNKLKGKITIDSKEGDGTTVTITLPNERMKLV